MKENKVLASMYPKFKEMLKLEAASKGMTMVEYQKKITESESSINEIAKEWKEKWGSKLKSNDKKRFDFL